MSELARRVAARYVEVNGEHPMTPADDAYVDRYFVTLDELCVGRDLAPDQVRAHMLAGRLPLPSYLRSDGAEMVPADLLDLAERAGGVDRLPAWFELQWPDRGKAAEEWGSYLSGRYVARPAAHPGRRAGVDGASVHRLRPPPLRRPHVPGHTDRRGQGPLSARLAAERMGGSDRRRVLNDAPHRPLTSRFDFINARTLTFPPAKYRAEPVGSSDPGPFGGKPGL